MFNEQSQKYLFGSFLLEARLELHYTRIPSINIIITSSSITGIIYHHKSPVSSHSIERQSVDRESPGSLMAD